MAMGGDDEPGSLAGEPAEAGRAIVRHASRIAVAARVAVAAICPEPPTAPHRGSVLRDFIGNISAGTRPHSTGQKDPTLGPSRATLSSCTVAGFFTPRSVPIQFWRDSPRGAGAGLKTFTPVLPRSTRWTSFLRSILSLRVRSGQRAPSAAPAVVEEPPTRRGRLTAWLAS